MSTHIVKFDISNASVLNCVYRSEKSSKKQIYVFVHQESPKPLSTGSGSTKILNVGKLF